MHALLVEQSHMSHVLSWCVALLSVFVASTTKKVVHAVLCFVHCSLVLEGALHNMSFVVQGTTTMSQPQCEDWKGVG